MQTMLNSSRNSLIHNEQAKLALIYNELLRELSSKEMTSVGCYNVGETIGQGTYGKVKKGVHKLTGKVVAIKKINKEHAPILVREIHHHKQLKHPNIIMLYEMITTESSIHIISEYASNGDVLDALAESGGRCNEDRVLKWFHQMTNAIGYCHTRGIVHSQKRDLKLENLLLDKDDNIKICDFGFARYSQKNQLLDTFCGSLCYSAPEIILRKKYTGPETDIWSLGVILYTLISGEYPFDDDSEVITQRNIVQVSYEMPSYFSPELSHFIDSFLQFEPSARISIAKIKTHPWYCQSDGFKQTSSSHDSFPDFKAKNIYPSTQSSIESKAALCADMDHLTNIGIKNLPRYSMPALNHRSILKSSLFRTSLPSKLPSDLTSCDPMVTPNNMSPCEKRLLSALNAAGFDKGTLIKMQTGECDTSRTLWHLLLENMKDDDRTTSDVNLTNSVSNTFTSAIENHHQQSNTDQLQANGCICRNQPSSNENLVHVSKSSNMKDFNQSVEPYPIPVVPTSANIQIVGFGSEKTLPEKGGWLTSIKSWFGTSNNQQQQQKQQKKYPPKIKTRSCTSFNSLEKTTSSNQTSNYSEFHSPPIDTPELSPMSPPIYRSGSQKYRRRKIQLSNPYINEVDQLSYSMISSPVNLVQNKKEYIEPIKKINGNMPEHGMPSPPPPTAESFSSTHEDSLSLVTYTQPIEVDVCEKRYSMYRHQQPTPPPSPPIAEPHIPFTPITTFSPIKDDDKCLERRITKTIPDLTLSPTTEHNSNRFKLNSPTRPRLALYGIQQQKHIQTKIIIEEEEEEDDEDD